LLQLGEVYCFGRWPSWAVLYSSSADVRARLVPSPCFGLPPLLRSGEHKHEHHHQHHKHTHSHHERPATTAAKRFGIISFVYARRRPFHPQRYPAGWREQQLACAPASGSQLPFCSFIAHIDALRPQKCGRGMAGVAASCAGPAVGVCYINSLASAGHAAPQQHAAPFLLFGHPGHA
jgi:hypothetical protein